MKVVFKICLSGNVFYQKGQVVELEENEAKRLLERGIVEVVKNSKTKTQSDELEGKK